MFFVPSLRRRLGRLAGGVLVAAAPTLLHAQPTVTWTGQTFLDYRAVLTSPLEGEAGANGFNYRRLNLGAEVHLSERFDLFSRLEAQGGTSALPGRPTVFIKDLHVTWRDALGPGHHLRLGVQSPPLFQLAEETWGYRSLAQTVIDRVGANGSRDFGLRADGPLGLDGALRYGAMVANGDGLQSEEPLARGKHVYGQLQFVPEGPLRASLGLDYTSHEADEPRAQTLKGSAFLGAVAGRVRGGVEAFAVRADPADPLAEATGGVGGSAFGAVATGDRTSVVGRLDWVDAGAGLRNDRDEVYGLAAFVYRPSPRVEVMPNAYASLFDGQSAEVVGRLTVHAWF